MASSVPSSPVADAALLGSAPPMGGSASTADAAAVEPTAAASASPSAPASTSTASGRDEVALAKAAAEAAATVATASGADDAAAEGLSPGEEEEQEEAGNNKGAASNPTHNWVCSAVEEGELRSMAFDGVLPPSSEAAPAWRSALGDPSPTPIRDERVLLSSHISRGFSLPPSAFLIEILDHYGLQLHNITPNSLLYISGFVALFEAKAQIIKHHIMVIATVFYFVLVTDK